jgi:hypothetical protein
VRDGQEGSDIVVKGLEGVLLEALEEMQRECVYRIALVRWDFPLVRSQVRPFENAA